MEEIKAAGPKIRTSEDWKRELSALGDKAVSEGRTEMFYDYYKFIFDNGEAFYP